MKLFTTILFYLTLTLFPIGIFFNVQNLPGAFILFSLGLLGFLIFFIAKSIKDVVQKTIEPFNLTLQLFFVLMSVVLFFYYVRPLTGAYWRTAIAVLFVITVVLYFVKGPHKYDKIITASIAYLILSLPVLGLSIIPGKWDNTYTPKSVGRADLPYTFQYTETEQLSIEAYELHKKGRYEDAILRYEKARQIEPKNPRLLFDLSNSYARINDFRTAVAMLDSAIILDNRNASFYGNRGLYYFKMNENQKAIADLNKGIQLDSTQAVFYANLALVYEAERNYNKACEYIQKTEKFGIPVNDYPELEGIQRNCK